MIVGTSLKNLSNFLRDLNVDPAVAFETECSTVGTLGFRQLVGIQDHGEELCEIPPEVFSLVEPHPYKSLGAPYRGCSPYMVRASVLERLISAHESLVAEFPNFRIQIYDAYRPVAVQEYMVNYEFDRIVSLRGHDAEDLDEEVKSEVMREVYSIWAKPDANPACPPPHSTGAAIDATIVDGGGLPLPMGGEIDEIGSVSLPSFFRDSKNPTEQLYHHNRELLLRIMSEAGFHRLPHEWWHFSYGDQMWALLEWLGNQVGEPKAHYGIV